MTANGKSRSFINGLRNGVVAMFIFGLLGCQTPDQSVVKKTNLRLKGLRRSYRLYIPKEEQSEPPRPLVVVIHGAFSTAKETEQISGFSRLAEEEDFLVAYPNGMGIFGWLQHWNAGHCCGKAQKDGVDDVGFVQAVIDDVKQNAKVDGRRIYLVGFSNGGMLVHRFAAERSKSIAAVTVLAGAIGSIQDGREDIWQIPTPDIPVPMLIMHGEADDSVPYLGGASERHKDRHYLSVQEAAAFWAKHNGGPLEATLSIENQDYVHAQQWSASEGQAATVLYTLRDWQHQWPTLYRTEKLPVSHPLHGFDGARVIWQFLEAHSR